MPVEKETNTGVAFDIRYGFLTGNLFSGWSTEELQSIDVDRSVAAFKAAVEEKLRAEYPGARVNVVFEHAEGIIPASCRTWCIDLNDPDADTNRECEAIEYSASLVYEAGNWVIPRMGSWGSR